MMPATKIEDHGGRHDKSFGCKSEPALLPADWHRFPAFQGVRSPPYEDVAETTMISLEGSFLQMVL